jgi:uncharacterized protein Yka (UPF0111/DUF47 family)
MFKPFSRSASELFHHLSALGVNLEEATARLDLMVSDWDNRERLCVAIQEGELAGDRLLSICHAYLQETFFVPGDREGIYALTNELDDIVDKALKIANYLLLYRITEPIEHFSAMVRLLRQCCVQLRQALCLLGDRTQRSAIEAHCFKVIELEDEADAVHRLGLEALFDNPTDLNALLKWKDLLEWADDTVDHANHLAYRIMALNSSLY